jgi:hypothetical protein
VSAYMNSPCANCPFLREGGIRLTSARVDEIAGMMLSPHGGEFPCHKTTREGSDGDLHATAESAHCGGALLFAEKNGNSTQMMRIAERLGLYDPSQLKGHDRVFDTVEEMKATAVDAGQPRRRKARR